MGDSRRLSYREVSHVGVLDRSAGEFCWNCRPCKGTELHIAALEGDLEAAKRLVSLASEEEQRVAVTSRFTYETIFNDKEQEGSGEAIHLAVSRGHVQVAKYLLSLGAELENTVSRDHRPHYNVLHAAMFAEGRGGSLEMIKYLLEAKASPMIKNLDGRYPLHIAFMTGNVQVITFLREFLLKEGIEQHHYQDSKVPLPLSLGICEGKMSEEQLSDAAELSTLSLTTFISECPQCIPSFLKRFSKVEHISAKDLARSLTRFDIARVLRESPEAAMALLDHATDLPECSNPGWHSLPTRVSFAPRNFAHKFQELFNPPTEYFTFYEEQHTWEYDSLRFQAPKWHSVLTDRSFGRPIVDAEVQVCHVPDLACAEVFAAICDSGSADGLGIFDNDVVHAAITHVFWSGCSRADLTIVLLSAWGLALLILEEMFLRSYPNSEEVFAERSLLAHGGHGGHASGDVSDIMSGLQEKPRSQQDIWIALCWVAAKAIVDLFLELVRFVGLASIGRHRDYFAIENLIDVLGSCIPMYLVWDHSCLPVMVITVFLYWRRVLDFFIAAEYIARKLLPIKRLIFGILPALSVAGIAFAAFCHAFFVADGGEHDIWPGVLWETFSILITSSLPEFDADSGDQLKLILALVAVLFFSVFILNIFIGVMSEVYMDETSKCQLTYRRERACACLNYLLRSRVMACGVFSKATSYIVVAVAASVAVGIQFFFFRNHLLMNKGVGLVFMLCQGLIVFCAYQDPESPLTTSSRGAGASYYIWYCKKAVALPQADCQEEVRNVFDSIQAFLAKIEADKIVLSSSLQWKRLPSA
ncbi:unnamed protein product [Polarella glacialis]|uniref:Ion transport domain-containing protein n=1 Tax=Polarella glacialis TaxID=89957 RepID=A0A813FV41_POLGL|nr:unnamed protein product [Polarella glacialis]